MITLWKIKNGSTQGYISILNFEYLSDHQLLDVADIVAYF